MSARSCRALRTISIDLSIAPETQNWWTIPCETMFGEMYVWVAILTTFAISSAGPTR